MTNARHQAATRARARTVTELRALIVAQLDRLQAEAGYLEDLASTRQTTATTVLSRDDLAARRRQETADRAAALGLQPRDGRVGLAWLQGDPVNGAGQVAAPVTITAVSTAAQIRATLQRWVARLGLRALVAARHAPRPVTAAVHAVLTQELQVDDQGVRTLAARLAAIVGLYSDRRGLEDLLRDLDRIDARAGDVIDGPARARHADPCPWCGRHTLVIHHRSAGRDAAYIRCEGTHDCRCRDEWCPCHRPGSRHRHEWENSRHATHTWTRLEREQASRRDDMEAEQAARDTLEQVRALHTQTHLHPWVDECTTPGHTDADHVETEDASGYVCVACPPTSAVCRTCRDEAGALHPWPCPTAAILDPTTTEQD